MAITARPKLVGMSAVLGQSIRFFYRWSSENLPSTPLEPIAMVLLNCKINPCNARLQIDVKLQHEDMVY